MARIDLLSRNTIKSTVDTLVGSEPLIFARACRIRCSGTGLKPMTYMNVFVDGIKCNKYAEGKKWETGLLGAPGEKFRTNNQGDIEIYLNLPAGTFKTGSMDIIVTDGTTDSNGTCSLSGVFHSNGTLQVFRRTTTNLTVDRISWPYDPVAQGFFTFGAGGPVSITSIDLYFASKDENIPVQLQIRKVVAGLPDFNFVSADAVVDMPAAEVKVTGDADNFSTPTTFRFKVPIVLEADQQYCFVVQSNSNAYYMYMASQGEQSFETKKVIFEQPYSGIMFKSANNFTWTPMQSSALKFRINKATYDSITTPRSITLGGNASSRLVSGGQFFTKTGSNKIIYKAFEQHGYTGAPGEFISIRPNVPLLADPQADMSGMGSYNGFTLSQISGDLQINRIIDNYTVEFISAGGVATSTGPITSAGMITFIQLDGLQENAGYPSEIVFPPPMDQYGNPTGDPAIAIDYTLPENSPEGVPFQRITLEYPGVGYTQQKFNLPINGIDSNQGYIRSSAGGNGFGPNAQVTCFTDASFVVDMVKPISLFTTNIGHIVPAGAEMKVTHTFTKSNKDKTVPYDTNMYGPNYVPDIDGDAIIANNSTAANLNLGTGSININIEMLSNDPNVSPMYNFTNGASLSTFANVINDQAFDEDITATLSSSGVIGIEITGAGSGYGATPVITITPAEDETNTVNITPAVAHAEINPTNGNITNIVIDSPGAGYTRPPMVEISSPTIGGTPATAVSSINKINSELLSNNGRALGRYLTKTFRLAMPSTGIRVRSKIVSTPNTSVEWYIKCAMNDTPSVLDDQPWKILSCDTPRHMSKNMDEQFEYEFNLSGLPEFTCYKLKAVMSSKFRNSTPYIKDYKIIITA